MRRSLNSTGSPLNRSLCLRSSFIKALSWLMGERCKKVPQGFLGMKKLCSDSLLCCRAFVAAPFFFFLPRWEGFAHLYSLPLDSFPTGLVLSFKCVFRENVRLFKIWFIGVHDVFISKLFCLYGNLVLFAMILYSQCIYTETDTNNCLITKV